MHDPAIVVCVDDEPMILEVLEGQLAPDGHDLRFYTNGKELLDDLEVLSTCDIVLLDVMMEGLSGYETCERIREKEKRFLPILLVTALGFSEHKVRGLDAGADDFITKPTQGPELRARVRAHLRAKELHDRLDKLNRTLEDRVRAQVQEIGLAQHATIFALSKLAESRDPETGAHIERMREYCRLLADKLRTRPRYSAAIDDVFVDTIYAASPLHDIGKVGISDNVLLKPDKHTPEERLIMQTHTIIGAETLKAVLEEHPNNELLRMGIEIAESHHESWDGTGYPHGLAGERIPLSARILALADVYDALTSKRIYKSAFSHDVSRKIIVADRSRKFDPGMVDTFLEIEKQFRTVRERFTDEQRGPGQA